MTARLYGFGESGNAYKVALTLELAGMQWSPVFVDFFKGEARGAEFRARNIMGEVPVFEHDGLVLSQSGAIQIYILDQMNHYGAGKLGGAPEDKYELLRWMFWDNHKFSAQIGQLRFLMNFLSEEKRPHEAVTFLKARLRSALKVLNAHLEVSDWLVSDALTVADLGCCCYLFYDEPFGFDRAEWPGIDAWLSRISKVPGWKHPYDFFQPAWTGRA